MGFKRRFQKGGQKQKGSEKIEVKRGKGVEKRTKPKKEAEKEDDDDDYEPSDGAWTVGDGVGSVREFARKDE